MELKSPSINYAFVVILCIQNPHRTRKYITSAVTSDIIEITQPMVVSTDEATCPFCEQKQIVKS